jgi:hypothetical protein
MSEVQKFGPMLNPTKFMKRADNKPPVVKLTEMSIESVKVERNCTEYHSFTVQKSGHYHISSQLSVRCVKDSKLSCIQFGVCEKDFNDSSELFNSNVFDLDCMSDQMISNNLSSIKKLDENKTYIAWVCMASSENNNFEVSKDYSNIKLLKIE